MNVAMDFVMCLMCSTVGTQKLFHFSQLNEYFFAQYKQVTLYFSRHSMKWPEEFCIRKEYIYQVDW